MLVLQKFYSRRPQAHLLIGSQLIIHKCTHTSTRAVAHWQTFHFSYLWDVVADNDTAEMSTAEIEDG